MDRLLGLPEEGELTSEMENPELEASHCSPTRATWRGKHGREERCTGVGCTGKHVDIVARIGYCLPTLRGGASAR